MVCDIIQMLHTGNGVVKRYEMKDYNLRARRKCVARAGRVLWEGNFPSPRNAETLGQYEDKNEHVLFC